MVHWWLPKFWVYLRCSNHCPPMPGLLQEEQTRPLKGGLECSLPVTGKVSCGGTQKHFSFIWRFFISGFLAHFIGPFTLEVRGKLPAAGLEATNQEWPPPHPTIQ